MVQASGGSSAPWVPDADQAASALLTGSGVMTERLRNIVHHDRTIEGQIWQGRQSGHLCRTFSAKFRLWPGSEIIRQSPGKTACVAACHNSPMAGASVRDHDTVACCPGSFMSCPWARTWLRNPFHGEVPSFLMLSGAHLTGAARKPAWSSVDRKGSLLSRRLCRAAGLPPRQVQVKVLLEIGSRPWQGSTSRTLGRLLDMQWFKHLRHAGETTPGPDRNSHTTARCRETLHGCGIMQEAHQ